MAGPTRDTRAFVYRGGIRVAGTVLACDASAGADLVFLSHAPLGLARGRRATGVTLHGRRRVLATEVTLALLGQTSDRRRARTDAALVAVPGRPFSLGGLRLEVFGSGWMPGSASLFCEHGGRRLLYAGRIGLGPDIAVRAADAVCIDVRHVVPRVVFLPQDEAIAAVGRRVRGVLAGGAAPIVLFDAIEAALAVAASLAADRIALRAHRAIVQAASAFLHAGVGASVPARFAGRLGPGEVLLWPARERPPARRGGERALGFVHVARDAGGEAGLTGGGVAFSTTADFAGVIRYIEAAGASEVALVNASGDELASALLARGVDAYTLGPPRQTDFVYPMRNPERVPRLSDAEP